MGTTFQAAGTTRTFLKEKVLYFSASRGGHRRPGFKFTQQLCDLRDLTSVSFIFLIYTVELTIFTFKEYVFFPTIGRLALEKIQ